LIVARGRCESLIPGAHPRPFLSGLKATFRPGARSQMYFLELNKILGAVLAPCLVLLATSFAAGAIFAPVMPEKPGFEIAVKEEAPAGKEAAPAEVVPIAKLLQTASVEKGEAAAKKCGACH